MRLPHPKGRRRRATSRPRATTRSGTAEGFAGPCAPLRVRDTPRMAGAIGPLSRFRTLQSRRASLLGKWTLAIRISTSRACSSGSCARRLGTSSHHPHSHASPSTSSSRRAGTLVGEPVTRRVYVYRYISQEAATEIETCQIRRYLEWVKEPSKRPAPRRSRSGGDRGHSRPN